MKNNDILYSKVMERLNSPVIESDHEVVSAADICNALSDKFAFYNYVFVRDRKSIIKKLSKNGPFVLPFVPYFKINDIKFIVNENGEAIIKLFFKDDKALFVTGDRFNVKNCGPHVCNEWTCDIECKRDFIKANKELLCIYLGLLKEFASNFPGIEMNFGVYTKNPLDVEVDDGFLRCKISAANPDESQVMFSTIRDHYESIINAQHGVIHDYIAFYNKELLSKIPVNVNELNPFVKECVFEYLNRKDENKMVLSK